MISYQFNKFITTQEDVMKEMKKVIDLKALKEIKEDDFTEIIALYYLKYKELVFDRIDRSTIKFKGTPQLKLGKKRIKIIGTCLEAKQIAELIDNEKGIFKIL